MRLGNRGDFEQVTILDLVKYIVAIMKMFLKMKRTAREDVASPDHAPYIEAIELESVTDSRLSNSSCNSIRDLRSTQLHEVTDLATGCVDVRGLIPKPHIKWSS